MARGSAADTDYRRLVWDRLDGIPYPGEHTNIFGHDDPLNQMTNAYKSGKMHHAWLVSGPKGIGKATFSLAVAGHILRHSDTKNAPEIWNPPTMDDPVISRMGKGGHPNLLQLSRPWDPKRKTFRASLTIDEVRRTVSFFGTTSGEDTWRICIVDTADDMTANAANALLKILEEPPERTVFFVLSNSPGKLLPTIRSRCRQLSLRPLSDDNLIPALECLDADVNGLQDEDKNSLLKLSGGSVRRALVILEQDGLNLSRRFGELLNGKNLPGPDWVAVHRLADELSRKNQEDQYRLLFDIAQQHINSSIHSSASNMGTQNTAPLSALSNLARMCEVWDKTTKSASLAESYNLDKKQVILNLFGSLAQVS